MSFDRAAHDLVVERKDGSLLGFVEGEGWRTLTPLETALVRAAEHIEPDFVDPLTHGAIVGKQAPGSLRWFGKPFFVRRLS